MPPVSKQGVLRLYRHILKSHRAFLPGRMRILGDEYVKNEWRQHKNAEPQFVLNFYTEWRHYLHAILSQNNTTEKKAFGKELSLEQLKTMSSEQIATLDSLRTTATAPIDQIK